MFNIGVVIICKTTIGKSCMEFITYLYWLSVKFCKGTDQSEHIRQIVITKCIKHFLPFYHQFYRQPTDWLLTIIFLGFPDVEHPSKVDKCPLKTQICHSCVKSVERENYKELYIFCDHKSFCWHCVLFL